MPALLPRHAEAHGSVIERVALELLKGVDATRGSGLQLRTGSGLLLLGLLSKERSRHEGSRAGDQGARLLPTPLRRQSA